MKLAPFCLKYFAATTITEREHQAIKLVDHTHLPNSKIDSSKADMLFSRFMAKKTQSGDE